MWRCMRVCVYVCVLFVCIFYRHRLTSVQRIPSISYDTYMRPSVRIYASRSHWVPFPMHNSIQTLPYFFLGNSSLSFFSPNRTRHIWKYNEFSYVFMRYIFHNLFPLCSIVFFFSSYSSSFSSLPRMRTKFVCSIWKNTEKSEKKM